MHKRYQIIKPFLSDKIVEASSLEKGAKQCYRDVKLFNATKNFSAIVPEFAIKDIDSNEIFRYKINIFQKGGGEEVPTVPESVPTVPESVPTAPDVEPTIPAEQVHVADNNETTRLAILVAELTSKIGKIEKQLALLQHQTSVFQTNVDRLQTYGKLQKIDDRVDDGCAIM